MTTPEEELALREAHALYAEWQDDNHPIEEDIQALEEERWEQQERR